MIAQELKKQVVDYLMRFNPQRIAVFGSVARNEENKASDLDLLVSFKDTIGLLQLIRIQRELTEIVGRKVDLVTNRSLKNSKLKAHISKDLQIIYG